MFDLSVALQTPIEFFFHGLPGHIEREQRNGKLPKNYVSDQSADDPLGKNESLRLINLYWKLPSDKQRSVVMNLLQVLNGLQKKNNPMKLGFYFGGDSGTRTHTVAMTKGF